MKTQQETETPKPNLRFEMVPIPGPCHPGAAFEALLKSPGRVLAEAASGRFLAVIGGLILISFFCLGIYGIVAGSLSGGSQMWIAPLKMILGALMAALICLPSLYIFLCLGGADVHVRMVAGELASSTALMSLLLLGFAPVAWVFSQSTDSVAFMAVLHFVFWGIAMGFGLALTGRSQSGREGSIGLWRLVYVLVCLQMLTSLRPIIGRSNDLLPVEKKFFLVHAFDVLTKPSGK